MSRDFDGADDNINFGSDASIDDFVTRTVSFWLRADASAASTLDAIITKVSAASGTGWSLSWSTFYNPDLIELDQHWAGADTSQFGTLSGNYAAGQIKHICFTYDRSSTSNAAQQYINGNAESMVQAGTKTAPSDGDAGNDLVAGETAAGANDFDGAIEHFCYANAIWTAAQVNRARWWGRPGGGIEVYHPLVTDKLANEGTATADGTATGTTVQPLVTPVVRRGSAMLGMGIGW